MTCQLQSMTMFLVTQKGHECHVNESYDRMITFRCTNIDQINKRMHLPFILLVNRILDMRKKSCLLGAFFIFLAFLVIPLEETPALAASKNILFSISFDKYEYKKTDPINISFKFRKC